MSKITVHGRATSSNVQIVMWAIAELGLDHSRLDIGGAFGGNDDAAFRKINPMGLVPGFEDGDLGMFESSAILRYLAAQYGDDDFWPTDAGARGRLDQWAEWGKNTLAKVITYEVFWTLIRTPVAERDADKFSASVAQLAGLAKMIDERLGNSEYLAGDKLSFADIAVAHTLYRYYTLDFDRAVTPNLDAYYRRLTQRPAFAEHVMVDYSSLQVE